MSIDRKRWALKAQELKFQQLESARRQAEGWRAGLAGLTALVGAVLIVKGRDNVTELAPLPRWVAVVLLAVALGLLVTATLLAVRASSGRPSEDILLSGEHLKAWTHREVRDIATAIRRATVLATTAVVVLAAAIGLTWLGPRDKAGAPLVDVHHEAGRVCGELVGADRRQLVVKAGAGRRTTVVPLASVVTLSPVSACR